MEIVVPPGQKHRREATWTDLHSQIAGGRFRGIILLAAYGYDTLGRISYKDHRLYRGDKDEFLKAYLDDRRSDELAILRELVPHVRSSRERLWLLTVVAKQDLWWPKRAMVEEHYRGGDYGAGIGEILVHRDRRQVRHEFAFTSLIISNFETGMKERLKPNAEGYDHKMHAESLRRLFETVDALKKWEAGE